MYSCVQTTSPSRSTKVDPGARPRPVWYLVSSWLRKSNDSFRGGNETSNFPEIPPGATDVGPSSEPGSAADGPVGDAADERSGLREHPATRLMVQMRSVK